MAARDLAGCRVPDDIAWSGTIAGSTRPPAPRDTPVRIVVLGSSSTVGAGATDPAHSYVAQLSRALATRDTTHTIQVFNAGINGQTAPDMLRRLRKDVLDRKPALVIWQTGVNDAIRGIGAKSFRESLQRGVAEMKTHGIAVVLVDQQDFTGAAKIPDYSSYVTAIADIAHQHNIRVLQRYRVMRYLSERRPGGLPSLLARDHLHMNDFAHTCIGELLADGIGRLLR